MINRFVSAILQLKEELQCEQRLQEQQFEECSLTIDELKIRDDEGIADLMDKISRYLVKEFKYILADFNTFFVKYVYDRDEELE